MKKKTVFLIILGYVLIIVLTLTTVFIAGRSYKVYLNNPYHSDIYTIKYSAEGVVENTDVSFSDSSVVMTFKGVKTGTSTVAVTVYDKNNELNQTSVYLELTVLPTGILYLTGYDFGGYQFVLLGMGLITFLTFVICLVQFFKRIKNNFFSYKTVLDLALVFFCGLESIIYFGLFFGVMIMPERVEGWMVYNYAGFIMTALFLLSIPLLIVFAVFMSVSNLSLIRHEGFGKNNLFGIIISLILFIGSLLCAYTAIKNPNSTGITVTEIKDAVIRCIVSSAFVYFECMLFATQICTQYAARRKPEYNKDFIIILGCKIRVDTTPYPLLKGRIDKAIEFYNKQLNANGKQAYFIPSGGKGNDETISEAQSIKNYLISHGIDENLILLEDRSETTLENMLFSKEVADGKMKEYKSLFSTTNYHVFRSGLFSNKAGLNADGIGAKTKWYFWPNAQIREFIGLVFSEWRINILFLLIMISLSVIFANIPSIISFITSNF